MTFAMFFKNAHAAAAEILPRPHPQPRPPVVTKVTNAPATAPAPPEIQPMSTPPAAAAVLVAAPKTENGFERFIDKLGMFFKKAGPLALEGAELARPFLALSPIGPEYSIALTGIEAAVKLDQQMQAASAAPLSGVQKMVLAVSVASAPIEQILSTKGITEPVAVKSAIAQFLQNVFNLQTGPVAVPAP